MSLAQIALGSQSWPMKAQGAATMSALASKLGAKLGPPHLGVVLNALVAGLAGRTWSGKVRGSGAILWYVHLYQSKGCTYFSY